ncbi:replication factor C subunit 1 [Dermatophagoides farinae]|uniref:Replication factor C subunit 1 n=1 Tax=Dermatophagoides farinae TaxID=6954 RepID=A0A922HZA4_DERFA|nr:replication factor C subunit 1 [Dermatophagoides farinae]
MNSIKKRKHPIVDVTNDDDDDRGKDLIQSYKIREFKNGKKSAHEQHGKKKRNPIIMAISNSDEDEKKDHVIDTKISDSINEIKKGAKIRARKLAAGTVDIENDGRSTSKSPNFANLSSKQPSVGIQLKRLYKSIDAISELDLIEKEIINSPDQSCSLIPLQAIFSTVIPRAYSENGLGFPQFEGKKSTTNKNNRIAEELASHMKFSVNKSKQTIVMDYLEPIKKIIIGSLKNLDEESAITNVIDLLEQYSLTKEDMDLMFKFSLWAGEQDPMKTIDSKIKAALTRAFNKKDFVLPYALDNNYRNVTTKSSGKKGKGKKNKKNKNYLESSQDGS